MNRNKLSPVLGAIVAAALLAAPVMAGNANGGAPEPAAPFSLTSRDGKAVSLAGLKGQVVLINFWATWCGPCRKEMPLLEQIQKKYGPLGFTMVGVNVRCSTLPVVLCPHHRYTNGRIVHLGKVLL